MARSKKKSGKAPKKSARPIRSTAKRTVKPSKRLSRKPPKSAATLLPSNPPQEHREPSNPTPAPLPWNYGESRMTLLVRDPWWLFAYWEVTSELRARAEEDIHKRRWSIDVTVLRVYNLSAGQEYFDVELRELADHWYVDVGKPDQEWVAEIGLRCHGGQYVCLVRSNVVKTPRYGVSDVLDEEWLMPDELYFKILGLAKSGQGANSLDMQEMFRRYFHQLSSSSDLQPRESSVK